MAIPSSTSSSDAHAVTESRDHSWPNRFPWGAVLAAIIVWAVDSVALGPGGPWDLLTAHMADDHPMERGVVSDRVELARAAAERDELPLVAVIHTALILKSTMPQLAQGVDQTLLKILH